MINSQKIIAISSEADFDKFLNMISEEMSIHKSISKAASQTAASNLIPSYLRNEIINISKKEKEAYDRWKNLYSMLVMAESYDTPPEERWSHSDCD